MAKKIGYARLALQSTRIRTLGQRLREAGCQTVYSDNGVARANPHQGAFQAALEALEPGDTLMVSDIKQFSRSFRDSLYFREELLRRGILLELLEKPAADPLTALPVDRMALRDEQRSWLAFAAFRLGLGLIRYSGYPIPRLNQAAG